LYVRRGWVRNHCVILVWSSLHNHSWVIEPIMEARGRAAEDDMMMVILLMLIVVMFVMMVVVLELRIRARERKQLWVRNLQHK